MQGINVLLYATLVYGVSLVAPERASFNNSYMALAAGQDVNQTTNIGLSTTLNNNRADKLDGERSNEGIPMKNTISPAKESKLIGNISVGKILMSGALVFLIITLGLIANYGFKDSEYLKFKSDLNEFKELGNQAKREHLKWYTAFYPEHKPEHFELEIWTTNLNAIPRYKVEFFANRDINEPVKDIKAREILWSKYIYPFLVDCNKMEAQDFQEVPLLIKKCLVQNGYKDDAAVNSYDAYGKNQLDLDKDALRNFINVMPENDENKGNTALLKFILANYEQYFELRKLYLGKRNELIDFLKKKHPNLATLDGYFASQKEME